VILLNAVAADAASHSFCFHCPPKDLAFSFSAIAAWLGISLVFAVPGFFAGMLLHRILVRVPLVIRLVMVATLTLALLFLLIGRADIITITAALLAAGTSYFDGSRVDAENSSKSDSENCLVRDK